MDLVEMFDYYWYQKADSRMSRLPLMQSPIILPAILFSYLYFILKCGPKFMKDRKPYKLNTFIKWYNILQIASNAFIVQQLISVGWFSEITVFCEPENYSDTPKNMKVVYILWFGLITKIVDLIETGVFVLRKKNRQISFLHLYHHVSTPLVCWTVTRYVPVAPASFPMLVNCAVHVIMYSYYLLSSFGGKWRKILNPIKPLITITQMVQFIVLIAYSIQAFMPYCNQLKPTSVLGIVDLIINFVLFYSFYDSTYVKPVRKME
ncbi:elongation of very long chain fatty acids protein 1-like [Osmia bicornis bicornis]|uniref:elongation of very long chain fatty acids protein 1-like n=1 Tax=Osmia bicornis bicornis TaxID=1437191 RepID=UPI0010F86194|nr:elongation of very long chain fatty acids protein 1-like [Osmia bicornis bicornis]